MIAVRCMEAKSSQCLAAMQACAPGRLHPLMMLVVMVMLLVHCRDAYCIYAQPDASSMHIASCLKDIRKA